MCPVSTGSADRLISRISRLEAELDSARREKDDLYEQIREEKLKLSQSEAKAQEDKAKLLSANAIALSDEYQRGFKNAETLLKRIIDTMMPAQSH